MNYIQIKRNNFEDIQNFMPNISINGYTERCPNGKYFVIIYLSDDFETIALEGDYIVKNDDGSYKVVEQNDFKSI